MVNSPYSKENVRQGILHYLLGRGVAGLAGFATVILMVRYMDVQNYAGFTALTGLISMLGVCAGLGLDRAISRYVPEARLERSANELGQFIWRITLIRLVAALIGSLILYILWKQVIHLFPDVHLVGFPISLVCFVIAETLFQHFSSVMQALIKQKELTRILLVQWAGRLLMIGWVVSSKHYIGLDESLWIMTIPEIAGVIIFVLVMQFDLNALQQQERTQHISKITNNTTWPDWSAVFKMAGNNYGFTLLAAPPQGYFMKMLAAIYLPAHIVAAYGFFLSIAERARQYIPLHFFYNLLEPVMIARYLKDQDFSALNYRCQLLYKSNLLLLVPAIAWVAVSGDSIDKLMTGGKFQGLTWILVLVMIQLTIGSHVVLLQLVLNSVEKSRLLIKASLNALTVMMIGVLTAVNTNVIYLLLCPILFSFVMNTSIIIYLSLNGHSYKPSWKMQGGVLISGLIAFALMAVAKLTIPWGSNSLSLMILMLAGVVIIYTLTIWGVKAIDKSEIILVRSLIKVQKGSF